MNTPEIIPSTLTFILNNDQAYTLPLLYLKQHAADIARGVSHEIEFYFAYWLKLNGYLFELTASKEDAGDWRAAI